MEGLGGEKPEFSTVKWISWEELLDIIVGFKKDNYVKLSALAKPEIKDFITQVKS